MASTRLAIEVAVKNQRAISDLQKRMAALEKNFSSLNAKVPKASNNIRGFGASAKGAAGGVRGLGAAVNAALGPIGAMLSAVGLITEGFRTLAAQDFAEAKVRSLGTSSKDLVAELKTVSAELKGQASVAELTAAAYDVASAGFVKAADAAQVLKAASLGATGGFSDINTVGNAATSVLNAYGLAASQATTVVDKFIQTQNDGKIVVAEYAQNIGKVASVAAGLGVSLDEVNAVISQSTASGVQAEVAFTGLKTALAQLASGQATERMKELGLTIDANTIASDGLLGTFKKIRDSGADMGQVLKLLGTESAPALAPVLNNLERFEELLGKQKNSAGAAARAQQEAADTIQGAWKRLQTAVQNFFSDQSALGDALKVTLQVLAYSLETTAKALNFLLAPIKAIYEAVRGLAGALDEAFNISETVERANTAARTFQNELGVIKDEFLVELAGAFEPVVNKWNEGMEALKGFWANATETMGNAATSFGNFVVGVWNSIAQGAQGVIAPIQNAFSAAFEGAMQIVRNFWNSLPDWLKSALSAASSVAGAVFGAVGNALNKIKGAAADALKGGEGAVSGGGAAAQALGGGGGGGLGGGGGRGGGSKAADAAKKAAEQTARRLRDTNQLVARLQAQLRIENEANEIRKIGLETELDKLEINQKYDNLLSEETNELIRQNLERARALELESAMLEEKKKQEKLGTQLGKDMAKMFLDQGKANEKLTETEELTRDIAQTVASDLSRGIQGLIQGTTTLNEIASQLLNKLGGMFLDAAFSGMFKGMGIKGFADGGSPPVNKPSIVGEKGPEIFVPSVAGNILPNDVFQAGRAQLQGGSSNVSAADAAFSDNQAMLGASTAVVQRNAEAVKMQQTLSNSAVKVEVDTVRVADLDVVTVEQFQAGMATTARQARAQVFSDMRNKPSTRSSLGMR